MNEATPTVIKRNLRLEFPEGTLPTAGQLSNKIAHCKRLLSASKNILTTGELKEYISQKLEIPVEKSEMYVTFHEVIGDKGEDNIRFTIVFTTQAMKERLGDNRTDRWV